MTQVRTNFDAVQNGFRFTNNFMLPFPTEVEIPLIGKINVGKIVYGLCGGMCFTTLDYFNAKKPVPAYQQANKLTPNYLQRLWQRQLDSFGLIVIPRVIEWMMRDDKDVARLTCQYEVPKMRRQLDKGKPVVLALIRAKGGADPTNNHQVVATGYDFDDASRQMTIYLYEPNYPGEVPTISLNLTHPSAGIQITQSTGEYLRGFFVINYSSVNPP